MTGQVLMARYLVEDWIGSGGMADVFRGLDLNTGRKVAIKVLKEEFARDTEFLRRFHREAQAAAALSHENLVGVYDLGHEDGIDFIIMEYVAGETLKEKINRRGALPLETAIGYAIELCSALEHAHEGNIIHRDIKPQNIIISEEGALKLTDFGIARATTSMTVTMIDGSVIGSVHYFSPEQARGDVASEPSDLYSLGVVLYEMVTGTVPFTGDSPVTLALHHLQEPPADPRIHNPDLPAALSKIILKALHKDIKDRYQSATAMKADLMRVWAEPDGDYIADRVIDMDDQTRRVPIAKMNEAQQQELQPISGHRADGARFGSLVVLSLIVIACAALVWLGVQIVSVLTNEELPLVPNLASLTQERAQERLSGLDYLWAVDSAYSDVVPMGEVISQSPQADTPYAKKSVVTIVISSGPEYVVVPTLGGSTREEASERLKERALVADFVEDAQSAAPRGEVIGQSPAAGERVGNGSVVRVTVSNPPLMRKVPDLSGRSLSEATEAVLEAGLEVGSVKAHETSEMEPGIVYRQMPDADTEAVEGSIVDIYVSAAPKPLYSKDIVIERILPDYESRVRIDMVDAYGAVTQPYNEVFEGGNFSLTLTLEERAGAYQTALYVDGMLWDSWTEEFGELVSVPIEIDELLSGGKARVKVELQDVSGNAHILYDQDFAGGQFYLKQTVRKEAGGYVLVLFANDKEMKRWPITAQ